MHPIEENQQPISIFFKKKTCLKNERRNSLEKWPGMNGKMMTLIFFELFTVYMKKLGQFFFHTLLTIHCSVASYKYFKKLISEV